MPVLTDTLKQWLTGFRAVKNACAQVNTSARSQTQNAFGNSTMTTLLPNPGNVVDFVGYANAQFANAGLSNWRLRQPLDTTKTFLNLMTYPLWHTLAYSVKLYIQSFCPGACVTPLGDLIVTTPLTIAFPAGTNDPNWQGLMGGLSAQKLDLVLATNAFTNATQLFAPGSAASLSDLLTALSAT